MTNDEILDAPWKKNDAGAKSLRDYFKNLLLAVWLEDEGFSGKRPFGNSGWDYEIYVHLIKIGALKGKLDEDGHVYDYSPKAPKFVSGLIKHCFKKV